MADAAEEDPRDRAAAGGEQPQDRLASWVGIAVQILAAGAALAAWVAVVGGARVWARLYSAGISPEWIAPAYSERALVGQGLRALLVPLALGALVAGVLLSRRTPPAIRAIPTDTDFEEWLRTPAAAEALPAATDAQLEEWLRTPAAAPRPLTAVNAELLELASDEAFARPSRQRGRAVIDAFMRKKFEEQWRDRVKERTRLFKRGTSRRAALRTAGKEALSDYGEVALVILGAVLLLALVATIWLLVHVHVWWLLGMLVITVLFALTVFVIALRGLTSRQLAAAFFTAVALWAGFLSFFREAGWKDPKFNLGVVVRHTSPELSCVSGFFVLQSDNDVYIARRLSGGGLQTVVIPRADVVTLAVGPAKSIHSKSDWTIATKGLPGAETCTTTTIHRSSNGSAGGERADRPKRGDGRDGDDRGDWSDRTEDHSARPDTVAQPETAAQPENVARQAPLARRAGLVDPRTEDAYAARHELGVPNAPVVRPPSAEACQPPIAMASAGGSASSSSLTTCRPNGTRAAPAILKLPTPRGIPMIVRQRRTPVSRCASANHQPASTNQRMLPITLIALCRARALNERPPERPEGVAPSFTACLANGIPMIVIAIKSAATK